MTIRFPLLSPIRFHDPSMEFDNELTFQNPDNRLSTSYDWENVNEVPYALPIPKQWPDGQPGIDCMINMIDASGLNDIYVKLYDSNDAEYLDCQLNIWRLIAGSPPEIVARIYLDGLSGSGIEDGYYTIKIFLTSDDSLLFESEALLIADWFIDCIPFEYWNFENDFGPYWFTEDVIWTGRVMAPIRLYDPGPQFEKEVYKDDPGVLTTLRAIPQRIFNFDSHPLPVHVVELIQQAFVCSTLYLDRIQINSEEAPEAELYKGTNLKYLTGSATFVDFNERYFREMVETEREDQSIDWDTHGYGSAVITGNSIAINTPSVVGTDSAYSDSITYETNELYLVKLTLTDDAGDSDLPQVEFGGHVMTLKQWGINWLSFRMGDDYSSTFDIYNINGEKAVFTCVIEVYKIV